MGFQERRTDNFNNNINLPPIEPVGLILDFQSMSKWLVLSVGGQKVSTRTQTESLKPEWLTLKGQCIQKTKWRSICGYIKVLSYDF